MAGENAPGRSYHHGDLQRVLLEAAVTAIEESGPSALSLRDLARRAGVSHAAPTHHFGDKAGLLTVLATQGFHLFADNLGHIREQTGSLLEIGVGYVRFAVEYRAHFEVMFRPELYHRDDPLLVAAKQRATDELQAGVATLGEPPGDERDPRLAGLAAWSLVHGFATLWLSGALPPEVGDDPAAVSRAVLQGLFPVP
ncbi:TetR/AcrR family transcriptional regulator [Micromonospora sp. NBC_01699]|uniref:TetR/AcrR family transcriptional regulator n=1 Tax=Micromonospora sp. NBC_01699 TaxID=2975984 RepID=UPI002E2D9D5E|nr:TetR/AcrR family transcriptional regulator [Micromonospora sp. NBC_01699]